MKYNIKKQSDMKVKVVWDTHDCSVGDLECIDSLPTIIDVPDSVEEENVADWITDEFGWCIDSWSQV